MSRRSQVFTGEKATVAAAYAEVTNRLDLGSGANCHRLQLKARSDQAGGKFGYVVVSKAALTDVAAAAALADPTQRVRFLAGPVAGDVGTLDVTFNSEFRYIYFLSASDVIDVSVMAEKE